MSQDFFSRYIGGLKDALNELDLAAIDGVASMIHQAYEKDRQIFIIGNGGSAATASHFACDLGKGASVEGKRRFRVISLTDNVSLMTAIGNDLSYDDLFSAQLENLVNKGDLVIGITASGNSPNILKAIELAKSFGARTIGLIGFGGGKLQPMVDHAVVASSRNYGHVEDLHLILEHMITQALRERIDKA
ncbi:MAG: SIS domain-containing protein [Phycisphaerae bacterium]|nr:SIS domain-containing protein [Phycisphaerae bacterium]